MHSGKEEKEKQKERADATRVGRQATTRVNALQEKVKAMARGASFVSVAEGKAILQQIAATAKEEIGDKTGKKDTKRKET